MPTIALTAAATRPGSAPPTDRGRPADPTDTDTATGRPAAARVSG
ncbi:hypothetical protein ACFVH7_30870 [Kitasatospora indigofera]